MFLPQQRLQPSLVRREGDQGFDRRHPLHQRRGVDSPPWARGAIAGTGGRGGGSKRRRAGHADFQHQLRAATAADPVTGAAAAVPVAGTAVPTTSTAAEPFARLVTLVIATAAPVTAAADAGAAAHFRPYPFEDGPVLRHAGRSPLSHAGGASLVASEEQSTPPP